MRLYFRSSAPDAAPVSRFRFGCPLPLRSLAPSTLRLFDFSTSPAYSRALEAAVDFKRLAAILVGVMEATETTHGRDSDRIRTDTISQRRAEDETLTRRLATAFAFCFFPAPRSAW